MGSHLGQTMTPSERRSQRAGRWALPLLTIAVLVGLSAPAAADGPPTGGCAEPYQLQPVADFGSGFQSFLAKTDRNADGLVCTRPLPEALPFPNINFVDNVVRGT